jgi:hypothetical protein
MYEVVIIEHGPRMWEWNVCDSSGRLIVVGWETKPDTEAIAPYLPCYLAGLDLCVPKI